MRFNKLTLAAPLIALALAGAASAQVTTKFKCPDDDKADLGANPSETSLMVIELNITSSDDTFSVDVYKIDDPEKKVTYEFSGGQGPEEVLVPPGWHAEIRDDVDGGTGKPAGTSTTRLV